MSNHEHIQQRNLEQLGYERPRQSEIEHYHRSTSAGRSKQPVFQIRATNFVKKIGFLTSKLGAGARFKSYQNTSDDTKLHVAGDRQSLRKARSMDILRSKAYVPSPVLNVTSFDSKALPRKSLDGSHESGSTNGIELDGLKSAHSRKVSNSSSIAHGLSVAAIVADAASLRPTSASSTTPESPGEPRSPNIKDVPGLGCETEDKTIGKSNSNGQNRSRGRSESSAPRPPEKRPAHPRLSTLPPLTFHLKGVSQDQRPQRFSPSVIVRPPPFPVLELPALPTPIAEASASGGQVQSHPRRTEVRLNSMPLLPREGSDSRENDPDHEGCVLDEDECDDEDNEEDGATGGGDAAGSEDEDEAVAGVNGRTIPSSSNAPPSPTSSFFSLNRSLPPLLTLPAINTPSLSTLLGSFSNPSNGPQSQRVDSGSGSLSAIPHHVDGTSGSVLAESMRRSRDEETTPKAAQANFTWNRMSNGSAQADYFSTSGALSRESTDRTESASESQFIHSHKTFHSSEYPLSMSSTVSSSSTSAVQTPTERNQPATQTPMISVVPPHSPWSRTETGAPFPETQLYKDTSFTTAKGTEAQVPHYTPTNVADGLPKRPSIYHHASKSMIELFSITSLQTEGTADADEDAPKFGIGVSDRDKKGKGKLLPEEPESNSHPIKAKEERLDCGNITLLHSRRDRNTRAGEEKTLPSTPTVPTSSDAAVTPSLRRQRSMPTFSSSGPPPPYPSFLLPEHLRRFAPVPRDDEGTEELPPYSNDIRLTAVIPRKMEFTAPGVPARDRKWRRVHCVLEGTAFRVYDAPPRITGVSAFGGWWERKMGVGDVSSGQCAGVGATAGPGTTTNIVIGRKDPRRRMKWEEELQAEEYARRRTSESATEEGSGRVSISSSTTTVEVNLGVEHDRPRKSKRNLAATLLHPNRSRSSLTQDRSSSPASPRSSFQSPRNSAESSTPPSARPSVDLSGISASSSSSTALSSDVGGSTFTPSGSISGLSTNSGTSSVTQTRWRGHLRSDSAQSSLNSLSRSNSRAQTPLIQETRSQTLLRRQSSGNSYLYHDPSSTDSPEPDERDLIRIYSLQNAESGLASDYMKRKNVIRVRMEGEQFLLQCKDVASVVEWIEGFQAASNIALDLDERPMPKGPIFPRRRRRRRVQRTESGTEQPAEATSRSEVGAGAETTSGTAL